jgi:DNA-binding transcriptional ArsR family regulator
MVTHAVQETDPLAHPLAEEIELAAVLHALSDPVRLQIVSILAAEPDGRPCGALEVPVTKSTASHHFRVLREAGVISQRDVGRRRLTRLRRDALDARFPGLLDSVLQAAA